MKLYRCNTCGKIILILNDASTPTICCGKEMELLKENTKEMKFEMHLPVMAYECDKATIKVGTILHPCSKEHHIDFLVLETCDGYIIKYIQCEKDPIVKISMDEAKSIKAIYAYCNLHGLWKSEVNCSLMKKI